MTSESGNFRLSSKPFSNTNNDPLFANEAENRDFTELRRKVKKMARRHAKEGGSSNTEKKMIVSWERSERE
jgi:hypothetical protein